MHNSHSTRCLHCRRLLWLNKCLAVLVGPLMYRLLQPQCAPCVSKPFTTSFLIPDLYRSRSLPPTLRRSPSALSPSLLVACVSRARIMAQPAGPEGADWKAKLNLPPKDTRIRTEVGSWMECSPSASAGRHSPQLLFTSRPGRKGLHTSSERPWAAQCLGVWGVFSSACSPWPV